MSYTKVKTLPNKTKKLTLRRLVKMSDDIPYAVESSMQTDAVSEQCGMLLVSNLNDALNAKNQALFFANELFDSSEDASEPLKDIKRYSQIIITDIVNQKGHPDKGDALYETKKVCIKAKQAGPVDINPNTGNYIRHFTITPDLLVDIYNFKR